MSYFPAQFYYSPARIQFLKSRYYDQNLLLFPESENRDNTLVRINDRSFVQLNVLRYFVGMGFAPYRRASYRSFNIPDIIHINDNPDEEYGYVRKDLQIFNKKCYLDIFLNRFNHINGCSTFRFYAPRYRIKLYFNIETNRLMIESNFTNYEPKYILKIIDEMIFHSLMY